MAKDYGKNLKWFLEDVECAEKYQVEDGEIEIYGEDKNGAECSSIIDIRELCGAALIRIKSLENALQAYAKYANESAMERDIMLINKMEV